MSRDTVSLRDIQAAIRDLKLEISHVLDDHEERIRQSEAFRNRFYGVMGIFTAFMSLAATFIWNRIFGMNNGH